MLTVKQVERVFMIGALEVIDTNPQLALKDSVRHLSKNYPQFRTTRLYEEDGVFDDKGRLVFTLKLVPPKVNG